MAEEPTINLINDDWRNVLPQYESNWFDLAIVDPPYGIGESSKNFGSRSNLADAAKYKVKAWDNESPTPMYFEELKRVSKNQIIWGANHIYPQQGSCWIVWDKDNGDNDFADCELAWTSFDTAVRKFKWRWAGMLQENMKDKERRIHPTQKPVALYRWLLQNYAEEGDKILDTHLGSGSIAIACYEEKFDLVATEIDEEYYESMMGRFNEHKQQLQLF